MSCSSDTVVEIPPSPVSDWRPSRGNRATTTTHSSRKIALRLPPPFILGVQTLPPFPSFCLHTARFRPFFIIVSVPFLHRCIIRPSSYHPSLITLSSPPTPPPNISNIPSATPQWQRRMEAVDYTSRNSGCSALGVVRGAGRGGTGSLRSTLPVG